MIRLRNIILFKMALGLILVILTIFVTAQTPTERQIAARFAPIFYQALGENPRSDYITNFNFDGDWRGDNNWANVDNKKFQLRAYVYYSVSETRTHYFIHYAVFHPRDYKGGEQKGLFLSELLRQGARIIGDKDPTGLIDEASLAHENDMEGALVVVAKNGASSETYRVSYVETLQHNNFNSYISGENIRFSFRSVRTLGDRVLLYIEPKGHGIEAYISNEEQTFGKRLLVYQYAGKADDPELNQSGTVGYELLPFQTTIWAKARGNARSKGGTFGMVHDYSQISISVENSKGRPVTRKIKVGGVGAAFLGKVGGKNMARPPWGWFDSNRRDDPLGLWFFDPARVTKRNFDLDDTFSVDYVRLPFWAIR